MKTQELLSDLGAQVGLANVSFNDEGVCRLVFNDQAYVDLERGPDDQTLYLHTVLGQAPAEGAKDLYVQLLAGNFLGQQTGGNTLSLEPGSSEICLCRTLTVTGLDAAKLADVLTDFIDAASRWTAIIEAAAHGGGNDESPSFEPTGGMMRV